MSEIFIYTPIKDASVNSDMPNYNQGKYYALFVGKYVNNAKYISFIQFNLPLFTQSIDIIKAELELYIFRNDYPLIDKRFIVYRLFDDFEETSINFQNQPKIYTTPYVEFLIKDQKDCYIKIDITKLFKNWNPQKQNYGILIKASNESYNSLISFYSKDHDEQNKHPKLSLDFGKAGLINNIKKSNLSNGIINFNIGNKYFLQKKHQEAYKYFKEAYKEFNQYDPHSKELLLNMSICLRKLDRQDDALSLIDLAIKYYPNFTDIIYIKGCILKRQNKIFSSINSFEKCIKSQESSTNNNYIIGSSTFKACNQLANLYLELDDYDKAYDYSLKSLEYNINNKTALKTLIKVLINNGKNEQYIKNKIKNLLGAFIDQKEYILLVNTFFELKKINIAYDYILEAQSLDIKNQSLIYYKGMCLLFNKDYMNAYNCFEKTCYGTFFERSIYNMILCKLLMKNFNDAYELLYKAKKTKNKEKRIIFYSLKNILENRKVKTVPQKNLPEYTKEIFNLLEIILYSATPEVFERSLQLLNTVENKNVLLKLAKLYYNNDFYELAYQEFTRSISIFDTIDIDGLNKMSKCLTRLNKK